MREGLGKGLRWKVVGQGRGGGAEAVDATGDALDGVVFTTGAAEPDVHVSVVGTDPRGDLRDADSLVSCCGEELDDLTGHFASAGTFGQGASGSRDARGAGERGGGGSQRIGEEEFGGSIEHVAARC